MTVSIDVARMSNGDTHFLTAESTGFPRGRENPAPDGGGGKGDARQEEPASQAGSMSTGTREEPEWIELETVARNMADFAGNTKPTRDGL